MSPNAKVTWFEIASSDPARSCTFYESSGP